MATNYAPDWKLYLVGGAILAIITGWFLHSKQQLNIYEGREVQELLGVSNFTSDEVHAANAKAFIDHIARGKTLTKKQKDEAVAIFADALRDRLQYWIDGVSAGDGPDTIRQKQSVRMKKAEDEVQQLFSGQK